MAVASGEMVTEREVVLGGQPGPLVPRAVSWSLGEGWGGVGRGGLWRREGGGCGEDGGEEEEGGKRGEHCCWLGGEDVQLVKGFTMQIWREENSHCSQIGELKPYYKKQSRVEACKGSYLWAAAKEDSEAASPAEPPRCSDSAWSLGHHPQTKSRKPDKSNPNALTPTTKLI